MNMKHAHTFDTGNPLAQRNTRRALILTAVMMIVEIAGGYYFNSMALLADGWHMSTHALAFGLTLFAYIFAQRYSKDNRFAFGTWKMEILGGYTSAILLLMVAGSMFIQSIGRLTNPLPIHYNEAISIAILGLAVNLICAWLLKDSGHHHGHKHDTLHEHPHEHTHHHQDLNLHSAYLHVIADAATSVLAIIALTCGKFWGADWLDPVMGIVGGVLVTVWAVSLIKATGKVLLDAEMDASIVDEVKEIIHSLPEMELTDLHLWRVGTEKYACIVSLKTNHETVTPEFIRQQLSVHEELVHVTVEISV